MIQETFKGYDGFTVTLHKATQDADMTSLVASLMTIRQSSPSNLLEAATMFASGDNPSTTGFEIMKHEFLKNNREALGHIYFTFIIEGLDLITAIELHNKLLLYHGCFTIQMPSAQFIPVEINGLKTAGRNPLVSNDSKEVMETLKTEYRYAKAQYRSAETGDEKGSIIAPFKTKCNIMLSLNGWSFTMLRITRAESSSPTYASMIKGMTKLVQKHAPESFVIEEPPKS